jgi:hypothetical protein
MALLQKKHVLVVIRRNLSEGRAAQGLRAAVAYAARGLEVKVALCGADDAAADAPVRRHLQTLRALGRPVLTVDAQGLCELLGATEPTQSIILW